MNRFLGRRGVSLQGDIDSILYFSLVWNMFESMYCDKDASIPTIERVVKRWAAPQP